MKKLIAILSLISALGFAVALANTNSSDNPSNDMSGTAPSDSSVGSDTSKNMDMSKSSDMSKSADKTTVKKHDKWTSAKSCTDENGVTFYKGKNGFSSCVDKMRKSEGHEQMGGTTPSDSSGSVMEKSEHSSDTTIEHPNPSDPSSGSNDTTSGSSTSN